MLHSHARNSNAKREGHGLGRGGRRYLGKRGEDGNVDPQVCATDEPTGRLFARLPLLAAVARRGVVLSERWRRPHPRQCYCPPLSRASCHSLSPVSLSQSLSNVCRVERVGERQVGDTGNCWRLRMAHAGASYEPRAQYFRTHAHTLLARPGQAEAAPAASCSKLSSCGTLR